jgi:ribonuclease HI
VLLATHRTLHQCGSAAQAEALACLEGIRAAVDLIHMPIVLEMDNAEIVRDLMRHDQLKSAWATTIEEIKGVMQCLQQVQVHKIKREANRVAHVLAQMAMCSRSCAEWRLCAPARILDLLNQECNPLFKH